MSGLVHYAAVDQNFRAGFPRYPLRQRSGLDTRNELEGARLAPIFIADFGEIDGVGERADPLHLLNAPLDGFGAALGRRHHLEQRHGREHVQQLVLQLHS